MYIVETRDPVWLGPCKISSMNGGEKLLGEMGAKRKGDSWRMGADPEQVGKLLEAAGCELLGVDGTVECMRWTFVDGEYDRSECKPKPKRVEEAERRLKEEVEERKKEAGHA